MAYTLLLVDDEPDILEAEQLVARSALPGQVDVQTATSADEGLDLLQKRRVDLIVADYRMPGTDGLEFLRRAGSLAPGVPRVLVSAYPSGSEPLAGSQGVADFVLAKPFTAARFREVLRAAMAARAPRKA